MESIFASRATSHLPSCFFKMERVCPARVRGGAPPGAVTTTFSFAHIKAQSPSTWFSGYRRRFRSGALIPLRGIAAVRRPRRRPCRSLRGFFWLCELDPPEIRNTPGQEGGIDKPLALCLPEGQVARLDIVEIGAGGANVAGVGIDHVGGRIVFKNASVNLQGKIFGIADEDRVEVLGVAANKNEEFRISQ